MMRYLMRLLFILLLFISNKSLCQTEIDLDPVTVTSSIHPQPASRTGRNIFVIKGDYFQNLPVNSIDELLRYLPGVEIQARGPMGAQSDIIIRGGTFQQVLVIIDGIRLNDPLTGHFNSYIPISPAEIDRIEILKGASSAIYGSEAVGGVVHIISKTFATKNIARKNFGAQVTLGEYGLFNANAGGFYSNGKTAIGGGILTNTASGQQQRGTNGFFDLHTASVSFAHNINDKFQIAIRSGYDDRNFSAQNFYTRVVSDTANESVKSFWNILRSTYQHNKSKISLSLGHKKAEDIFKFNSVVPANINKSQLWQALLQHEYKFSEATSIINGFQLYNRIIRSNNRGDHEEGQLGVFALLNHAFNFGLQVSPALRLDWNERRGTEFVPQINLAYRINKLQLRGSAGKTIRDADFTERYNNYNRNPVPSGQTIGNPDLEAEKSFSYEAGVDFFATSSFKIVSSFFERRHKKLIDYVSTPYAEIPRKENLLSSGTYGLAKNIAAVNTTGFETDFQYTYLMGENKQLWATLGLLWMKSKSSELTPSFYISSHAKFLGNFNMSYQVPHFRISLNGLYKIREEQEAAAINASITKDYFVMNGKAEILFLKNKLTAFTQVDNIFDVFYSDLLGSVMPGRWMMFGGKINF
jgi:vitamin B12 transporter